jgi:hypothetical protein
MNKLLIGLLVVGSFSALADCSVSSIRGDELVSHSFDPAEDSSEKRIGFTNIRYFNRGTERLEIEDLNHRVTQVSGKNFEISFMSNDGYSISLGCK